MSQPIEKSNQLTVVNGAMPVTQTMVDQAKNNRSMLIQYVSSEMIKDIHYGLVPGTKSKCLFKPGAESLRTLFGLSVKVDLTSRDLDRQGNFALYSYKATVTKDGVLLAECEGTCNSQEKKFKERSVYRDGKYVGREETPVCDILNTLGKMAQKRAFVGAVIMACGASDFFTQDLDDIDDARNIGVMPQERDVTSSIPNVTNVSTDVKQNKPTTPNCGLCGTAMRLSKAGKHYYCPNFKDGKGEHQTVNVGEL